MNEDIHDELFRRAAESYPLQTDSADWEAVLNKINSNSPSDTANQIVKNKKYNYRYLLLLLLLIPLAIFENNRPVNNRPVGKINTSPNPANVKTNDNQITPESGLKNKAILSSANKNSSAIKTGTINFTDPDVAQVKSQENINSVQASNNLNKNTVASSGKHPTSPNQRSKIKIKNVLSTAKGNFSDESQIRKKNTKKNTKEQLKMSITNGLAANDENNFNASVKKESERTDVDGIIKVSKNKPTGTTETVKDLYTIEKVNPDAPAKLKDSVKNKIAKNKDLKTTKENKKDKTQTKRFYIGIAAAPDLSVIKLQSLKKVGFNYGFLAGYRLTKKISIETGFLQDRKYYSSNGKYFSTKNIYLYPNSTIEQVDGVCKMLELPINVSYAFGNKSGSNWFGSVGLSSYFMQNEYYTYDINHNGNIYEKEYEYYNKTSSLIAVINISGGYVYNIGKIGNLRFEPYIKLPVKKIGTGKLPIQSGGIFIGFFKNIF